MGNTLPPTNMEVQKGQLTKRKVVFLEGSVDFHVWEGKWGSMHHMPCKVKGGRHGRFVAFGLSLSFFVVSICWYNRKNQCLGGPLKSSRRDLGTSEIMVFLKLNRVASKHKPILPCKAWGTHLGKTFSGLSGTHHESDVRQLNQRIRRWSPCARPAAWRGRR